MNLTELGISDSMAGINFASLHRVHSSLSAGVGNKLAKAPFCPFGHQRFFLKLKVNCMLPMLAIDADNQRFFAADHIDLPSVRCMFKTNVI